MHLLLLSGVLLVAAASAGAECTYFRVSYRLLHCESAAAAPSPVVAPKTPEFLEEEAELASRVTCACDYSLRGSDFLCDMDLTREVSQLIGSDDPAALCRRGKTLCASVCVRHLP